MAEGLNFNSLAASADVLDSLCQGVFVTDQELRICRWNRWLVEHTGIHVEEMLGRYLPEALPDLLADNSIRLYRDALRGQGRVFSQRKQPVILALPSTQFEPLRQFCRVDPLVADGRVCGTITYIHAGIEQSVHERELESRIADLERDCEQLQYSKDWFVKTLQSIGDPVIAADAEARIQFLNTHAERLTGWHSTAAMQQPLNKVFRIVDENTRMPIDAAGADLPVGDRVSRLAQRTLLIGKGGEEISVEVRRAPIRRDNREVVGTVVIFCDVSERRRQEAALAESDERFILAARAVGDVIWDWDLDSGRVWWSAAYQNHFGEQPDLTESHANWWLQHVHPEDCAAILRTSRTALAGSETTWRCQYRYLRSDGSYAEVQEQAFIQRNGNGEAKRIIGAVVDLSARRIIEREREEILQREKTAREEAEQATRAMHEFFAVVSHELRTPLNAMLGWLRVLQMEAIPSQEILVKALAAFERNISLQTRLVDDLLDSARLITGKLHLQNCRVDLAAVIEQTLTGVGPTAQAKDLSIETCLRCDHAWVSGDPDRLQQVLWNLLANAVKFTPPGGRIEVRLREQGAYFEIEVQDTGQGIDGDVLPYVFDRFRQAEPPATRRAKGLGLGLTLVRSLVELHGGKVHAESAGVNLGASFKVCLPTYASRERLLESGSCGRPALAADTAGDAKPLLTLLAGARVFLLEDSDDARSFLVNLCIRRGIEVQAFASATAFLGTLAQTPAERWPVALVCDIGLPDMDGYEVLRRVRVMESDGFSGRQEPLPAIAVTAFSRPEDRTRAMLAGYQVHLTKPVDPHELLRVLAGLVVRQQQVGSAADPVCG